MAVYNTLHAWCKESIYDKWCKPCWNLDNIDVFGYFGYIDSYATMHISIEE